MIKQEAVMMDTVDGCQVARTESAYPVELGIENRWFVSIRSPYPQWQWWHSHTGYTENEARALQEFLIGLSAKTLQAIIEEQLTKTILFR